MRKIKYILPMILTGFLLTNCSKETPKDVEFAGDPVSVKVHKPETASENGNVNASGRLVSKKSVNVSTRMMGHITSMPVEVGQSVRAGQQLVSINSSDIQAKGGQADAQIMQAQANYNAAKKDYDRFKNLYASESATQKELDDMTARYEMAQAGLKAAQQMKNEVNSQYRYANITAPISGTVTAKFAEQGDLANPGMPLLTIESPSSLQAQVLVSEQNITKIKPGMEVKITLKSIDRTLDGNVSEISKSAANTGGQYMVKINVPYSEELLPGMFVNVQFPIQGESEIDNTTVMIPETALVRNGQLTGVYVVSEQGTAVLRWLKIGKKLDEEVEVLSGLRADETYITTAEGKLYNGVKVNLN